MDEIAVTHVEELIESKNNNELRKYLDDLNISEIEELIDELPGSAAKIISSMSAQRAVNAFRILDFPTQEKIIKNISGNKLYQLVNDLPQDDRTALFEELKPDEVRKLLALLPVKERNDALRLLGYEEDSIGRLMTTDFVAVRPEWTIERVLNHIRYYGKNSETIDVIYIINKQGILLDDIRIREILLARPDATVGSLADGRVIALKANDHEEAAIQVFRMNNRVALPVVAEDNYLLGIVTVDDILWLANEEHTEDMQKIGGTEALDEPYLDMNIFKLYKKRIVWLAILFVGEMFTATAMGFFEGEIQKAVVLALFIPLIISSGGNSGSQASTLIIQAMALGEVKLSDWWRVVRRELSQGLMLGLSLGIIGFLRIVIAHFAIKHGGIGLYGEHWLAIAFTVGTSLLGIVLWGSIAGSMLPILLKRLGADPASSSAPFVATLVDVTGLIIYFSIALLYLRGIML